MANWVSCLAYASTSNIFLVAQSLVTRWLTKNEFSRCERELKKATLSLKKQIFWGKKKSIVLSGILMTAGLTHTLKTAFYAVTESTPFPPIVSTSTQSEKRLGEGDSMKKCTNLNQSNRQGYPIQTPITRLAENQCQNKRNKYVRFFEPSTDA